MLTDPFRLTSEKLTKLYGTIIYLAGGVEGRTTRAWVGINGLKLGDREERDRGHPLHGLPDAARVLLMRFLTQRLAMKAQAAADITNASSETIELICDHELASIDNLGRRPTAPRYILSFDRVDGMHRPTIARFDDEAVANKSRGPIMETRVELREVVRMARDNLVSALGFSTKDLPHDFADAPDTGA